MMRKIIEFFQISEYCHHNVMILPSLKYFEFPELNTAYSNVGDNNALYKEESPVDFATLQMLGPTLKIQSWLIWGSDLGMYIFKSIADDSHL